MAISEGSSFTAALVQELLKSLKNAYGEDNWDSFRFGPYPSSRGEMLVAYLNKFLARKKAALIPMNGDSYLSCFKSMEDMMDGFSATYSQLEDLPSKSLFIDILAYRILGCRKVKLPLGRDGDWFKKRSFAHSLIKEGETIKLEFNHWVLNCFELNPIGFPIKMFSTPDGILLTFILRQYEYQRREPEIRVQRGDYVIDAGGGWGDTALYFACKVEGEGRVYTFEFIPGNVEIMKRNLKLNPRLTERIDVVEHPLWEKSDVALFGQDNGPGSAVRETPIGTSDLQISALSIDDFVKWNEVPKVDFIKMDVEGAELSALKGALATIRKYRPNLAIAVYHKLNDLVQIPLFLSSLNLGYKFYLDHFTIHSEETVLFCTAD